MSDTFSQSFCAKPRDTAIAERDAIRDCLTVVKSKSLRREGEVRASYDLAIERLEMLLTKLIDELS